MNRERAVIRSTNISENTTNYSLNEIYKTVRKDESDRSYNFSYFDNRRGSKFTLNDKVLRNETHVFRLMEKLNSI